MASAFVSSILSKTSLVVTSVQRWAVSPSSSLDPRSSILEDLKKLERTFEGIQAVLQDAEEREIREESVNLWLKELKEVAFDAEDVLDEYRYEVLRAQVEDRVSGKKKRVEGDDEEEVSGSLSTILVSIPDGMRDRIRDIGARFDEISEDRERLRLREEDGERRVFRAAYPAPTSHMVEESSIYGREHDKQKVVDLLFFEGMGNRISVVLIVGKGGLRETTIAQLVYKEYFDLTGWVCASDDFHVTKLRKDIIESITRQSWDLTLPVQNTLEEKVKEKKMFLVLDDVWNEQKNLWESLTIPFVGTETVRIIVTCRNASVAEIMQTVHPYHPGSLSEDESGLADIGKQIVKKCSGLPLAMKTVESLPRHMTDEDSWKDILQSDLWEVDKNNETLAALRLSYTRMPAHLKPCFVYCSMFPKDYQFDKVVLVRLQMVQGYILLRGRRRMEEIGNEYFNDLRGRSFFDSCRRIRRPSYITARRLFLDSDDRFKMHDMIHDLAKSIAGNECCAIMDKKLPSFLDEICHLYVQVKENVVKLLCLNNFRALWTLLLKDKYRGMVTQEVTQSPLLLLRTRCLRTLEFVGERDDELPDSVGNLKHLRYLHIRSQEAP